MNVSESIIPVIKWEIMKILVSEIHTIFLWKPFKNRKNENSQIPLSHTTVSKCKSEWKIWSKIEIQWID